MYSDEILEVCRKVVEHYESAQRDGLLEGCDKATLLAEVLTSVIEVARSSTRSGYMAYAQIIRTSFRNIDIEL